MGTAIDLSSKVANYARISFSFRLEIGLFKKCSTLRMHHILCALINVALFNYFSGHNGLEAHFFEVNSKVLWRTCWEASEVKGRGFGSSLVRFHSIMLARS